ncbi:MAG: hypothetical protein AAFQ05_05270 [Pseudomonadota bacterium]
MKVKHAPTSRSWLDRLAHHRTGLAALSFAESTVVPVPLETLILPLMVGHPKRALIIALMTWLGCLAGASAFYGLGMVAGDTVVRPILERIDLAADFDTLTSNLGTDGLFWTVLAISFSPAPMQFATLGAGAMGGNFAVFLAAIALSRGARYFGLAILAQVLGPQIEKLGVSKRIMIPVLIATLLLMWGAWQLFGA